jgi:hypothetical protein
MSIHDKESDGPHDKRRLDKSKKHLSRETFYDVIQTAWKDSSFKDQLTVKQTQYIQTYMDLSQAPDGEWSPKNIPTMARVAIEIGVSRTASASMVKRILKIALPYYFSQEKLSSMDSIIEKSYLEIEEDILGQPEYIEMRYGQNPMHWKAAQFKYPRFGKDRFIFTGYEGKGITVEEAKKLSENIPIEKTTHHGPSPLSLWWHDGIEIYLREKQIHYSQAYIELHNKYAAKYPKESSRKDMFCPSCNSLLPLGEVIPNSGRGKITLRRKYCSDSCKTVHKRSSKK